MRLLESADPSCRQMVVKKPGVNPGFFLSRMITCKQQLFRVGDSGFEPLTSSASRKCNTFQELSVTYKSPAYTGILALTLFPTFQTIRLGCCTVAARREF